MSPLAAFAVTVLVEVPLYTAALVALRLTGPARAALLGVALNLSTHPVLWWLLAPRPSPARFVLAEVVVWVVEAALLWLVVRRDAAVLVAVGAGVNAASVLVGLLVSAAA